MLRRWRRLFILRLGWGWAGGVVVRGRWKGRGIWYLVGWVGWDGVCWLKSWIGGGGWIGGMTCFWGGQEGANWGMEKERRVGEGEGAHLVSK
jgi:hypothetical protein